MGKSFEQDLCYCFGWDMMGSELRRWSVGIWVRRLYFYIGGVWDGLVNGWLVDWLLVAG